MLTLKLNQEETHSLCDMGLVPVHEFVVRESGRELVLLVRCVATRDTTAKGVYCDLWGSVDSSGCPVTLYLPCGRLCWVPVSLRLRERVVQTTRRGETTESCDGGAT